MSWSLSRFIGILTHLFQPLRVIKKDMRLDTVPFHNSLRISRSAEMRHLFEPTVQRERMLKTRSAFPEEIFLAPQIDRLIFRHQSISRQRWHFAISIAALMCKLKPINRRAGER